MKRTTGWIRYGGLLLIGMSCLARAELDPLDQKISLSLQDAEVANALAIISARTGLKLELSPGIRGKVNYEKEGGTVEDALEAIASAHGLEYSLSGSVLAVYKPEAAPQTGAAGGTAALVSAGPGVHQIDLKYLNASEAAAKLGPVLSKDDKVVVDEKTNTLVLIGPAASAQRARQLIAILDVVPQQIVIETQIVETSNQFLRDIGVSMGDLGDKSLESGHKMSGFSDAPIRGTPTAGFKYMIRKLDARALDLRIAAAETEGDAKVISRPKVITVNNRLAKIESGVSFHVKTLTAVTPSNGGTSGGTASGGIAGGLSTVNAGLVLEILPSIIADGLVSLVINVNNSQPDEGTAVDGIPGVVNNSANTSVMVRNGETAVIAGLMKQSRSESFNKVPLLGDIPILGFLFRSSAKADRNNEMVIFISPSVVKTVGLEPVTLPGSLGQVSSLK